MALNLLYGINAFSFLAVAALALYSFYLSCTPYSKCRTGRALAASGVFFAISGLMNTLWLLGAMKPVREDVILIGSLFTIVQAVLFLFIAYQLTRNRSLLPLLLVFLLSVFAIQYSTNIFFLFVTTLSYALMLLASLQLLLLSNPYLRKAGMIGIAYSVLSVLSLFLIYTGADRSLASWFLPSALLPPLFLLLLLEVKYYGIPLPRASAQRNEVGILFLLVKYGIYVTTMVAFLFLSTVAAHEMGHAVTGQWYGCTTSKAIIYDVTDLPHTELKCDTPYNRDALALSGLIATLALAVILYLTEGQLTTNMSFLIFGFGLLIAHGDLLSIGLPDAYILLLMLFSALLILIGMVKMGAYYIKQQTQLCACQSTEPPAARLREEGAGEKREGKPHDEAGKIQRAVPKPQ